MKICYDEQGKILGTYADHMDVTGNFVTVPEQTLKKDFHETFGLGKYRVKDGKIVAVRGFRKPDIKKLESLSNVVFP